MACLFAEKNLRRLGNNIEPKPLREILGQGWGGGANKTNNLPQGRAIERNF